MAGLGILAAAIFCYADSSTNRAGLTIIDVGGSGWGPKINNNYQTIDSSAAWQATSNTFTSTNTFNQPVIIGNSQPAQFNDASTHYVSFQASATVNTTKYVWPSADGFPGQVFTTDGSGHLYFSTTTATGGVSVYPATATASFPYGLTASTAVIEGLIVSTVTASSATITQLSVISSMTELGPFRIGGNDVGFTPITNSRLEFNPTENSANLILRNNRNTASSGPSFQMLNASGSSFFSITQSLSSPVTLTGSLGGLAIASNISMSGATSIAGTLTETSSATFTGNTALIGSVNSPLTVTSSATFRDTTVYIATETVSNLTASSATFSGLALVSGSSITMVGASGSGMYFSNPTFGTGRWRFNYFDSGLGLNYAELQTGSLVFSNIFPSLGSGSWLIKTSNDHGTLTFSDTNGAARFFSFDPDGTGSPIFKIKVDGTTNTYGLSTATFTATAFNTTMTSATVNGSGGLNVTYGATVGSMTVTNTSIFQSSNTHISILGSPPVLTSCGVTPSIIGSDSAFTITGGTGSTGCIATFAQAGINTPTCLVSQQSMSVVNALTYSVSNTAITVSQTGLGTGKLDVVCNFHD